MKVTIDEYYCEDCGIEFDYTNPEEDILHDNIECPNCKSFNVTLEGSR